MRRKVSRLPDAYQEVEYIQSTATNPGADNSSGQYIDTLYTHNPNTKISIDIQFTTTAKQQRLFGVSTANSSYSTFAAYINGSTQWARATKDGDGNWQTTSVSADTNRHTFVLQNSNYVIYTNGATTYSGNNGNTMTKGGSHTLPLLCTWGDGDGKYLCHASAKLYSCKIWDNGTLVRDFVPCYRKSDNVIGLYDLVNSQFYTNSGTGDFTKGDDVPNMVEKQVWPDEGGTLSGYRDFTSKSQADLQTEGWGGQGGGSWSVSSSGLTTSRSTTDRSYLVSLPIQINTQAKSIKIYGLINRSVGSWYGSFQWGIRATNTCGSGRDDYPTGDWLIAQSANCNNNSGYMGYGAGSDVLGFTGPGQGNTSNLGYSGSDITVEAIIDLDGGTCSCSYKSGSTTIWSGSTTFDSATVKATLSGLSTNQYLSVFNRNGTGDYKYMKNFGYEIIY